MHNGRQRHIPMRHEEAGHATGEREFRLRPNRASPQARLSVDRESDERGGKTMTNAMADVYSPTSGAIIVLLRSRHWPNAYLT